MQAPIAVIAANTHRFDPAARSRATALVVALLVLWPLLVWSQFHPASLFDADADETPSLFTHGLDDSFGLLQQ